MPAKPCCGSKGPRHKKDCPEREGASKTTKARKTRTGGGKRSKRQKPEPAVADTNGHVHVPELFDPAKAKRVGEEYLGYLRSVRTNLDGLIGSVEKSLAIL